MSYRIPLLLLAAALGAFSQTTVTITADQIGSAVTYDKVWQKRYDAGVNSWGIVGNHVVTSGAMWLNSFPGESGVYRITFGVVLEEDGRPKYKVSAGGRILKQGSYPWPGSTACAGKASKASTIDIGEHQINKGEKIEIWGESTYECAADHGAYTRWYNLKFVSGTAPTTPTLGLDKPSLTFQATQGYSTFPAAQTVTATNTGAGTLPTLTASNTADWLKVTVGGTGNTQTLRNEIIKSGLAASTYSATVTVAGSGLQSRTYSVTFKVVPPGTTVPQTAMLSPAQGDSLQEGRDYTLVGTGQNLSWTYDANSDGKPETAIGDGDTVRFQIPAGVTSPRTITIILKGDNGTVSRTLPIVDKMPPIRLLKPNGGERCTIGDTLSITWTTDTTLITDVNIFFSQDDGKTWLLVNPDKSVNIGDADWQHHRWRVPVSMQSEAHQKVTLTSSSTCRIRVGQYDGPMENTDQSDGVFTMTAPGSAARGMGEGPKLSTPRIARISGSQQKLSVWAPAGSRVELVDLRGVVHAAIDIANQEPLTIDNTVKGVALIRIRSGAAVYTFRVTGLQRR